MTLFGGWLRQLILIIFLAVLADFLLPTKTMQKYVRMVMGLAVIAAMLQPVMPLFRGDFASSLAEQATSEILGKVPVDGQLSFDVGGLKQQLSQEQKDTEVSLLQQRLKEATSAACDCTITDVTVGTDSAGKVVSVTVATPVTDKQTIASITQFLSMQLALGQSQVKVVRGGEGGDSSGS